jgi:hypothetical protein
MDFLFMDFRLSGNDNELMMPYYPKGEKTFHAFSIIGLLWVGNFN